MVHLVFVTVLAKTSLIHTKLNSILLPQFTDTLSIYPSPVYQVLNVNWSTFLKAILLTLQSHGWNNGTHGGHQLGSGDLDLLPMVMWHTGVSLATVWVSWLLMGCPKGWFLPPPTPPRHPSHPLPLLSILVAERDDKKYYEIQQSEIEEVSYNKNQYIDN